MASPAQAREHTPPPVIGKVGRYTVFITPSSTPNPQNPSPRSVPSPRSSPNRSPRNVVPFPPPPVQVPPLQFEKPAATRPASESVFGFFWEAVAKVQDVHSSLDGYLADWFGLDQSKYQWALNDYYESNGLDKENSKQKETTKDQVARQA